MTPAEQIALASKMLKEGKTVKAIAKATGLSVKFIQRYALELLFS